MEEKELEEKVNRFKEWLFYKCEAARKYGSQDEIEVWETVRDRVITLF